MFVLFVSVYVLAAKLFPIAIPNLRALFCRVDERRSLKVGAKEDNPRIATQKPSERTVVPEGFLARIVTKVIRAGTNRRDRLERMATAAAAWPGTKRFSQLAHSYAGRLLSVKRRALAKIEIECGHRQRTAGSQIVEKTADDRLWRGGRGEARGPA
jgi:hypothetical protein